MFVFLSAPATVISANEKEMADRLDYGSTFFSVVDNKQPGMTMFVTHKEASHYSTDPGQQEALCGELCDGRYSLGFSKNLILLKN